MSRSYHVTIKDFKGLTAQELDEMAKDPNSLLNEWATKKYVKHLKQKERKQLRIAFTKK